jgi:hypothetical protein
MCCVFNMFDHIRVEEMPDSFMGFHLLRVFRRFGGIRHEKLR